METFNKIIEFIMKAVEAIAKFFSWIFG